MLTNKQFLVLDAVASWLHVACSTPDQAVQIRAFIVVKVLCSWVKILHSHSTLCTQVFKWVPENLKQGVALRWTSIPSRVE